MAIYALDHKFRFRNARFSPVGMVLTCIGASCKWRVYATKMKNVEKYEIRKLILEHTCSIDERAGNKIFLYEIIVRLVNSNENKYHSLP